MGAKKEERDGNASSKNGARVEGMPGRKGKRRGQGANILPNPGNNKEGGTGLVKAWGGKIRLAESQRASTLPTSEPEP